MDIWEIYLLAVLVSLIISVAAKARVFHFEYLKVFRLRSLKKQIDELDSKIESESVMKELLRKLYLEENSGAYLGKRLSDEQRSILNEQVEKLGILVSRVTKAWEYVRIDEISRTLWVKFKPIDKLCFIYFTLLFSSTTLLFLTGVYLKLDEDSAISPSWKVIVYTLAMSLMLFPALRRYAAGYHLKKHIDRKKSRDDSESK
ncbi:hypothetical protein [Idiomarina abyssalis]|uniref:hypothetical protein n=1 Tax=Idiomarina abyssalis TaxID=86102 RepID=UPI0006C86F45|nr:hypothetical protein [Idiomarina abyssalis]KPD20758.1 hypothetical protein ADS78_11045 [Idiomarina abyssalis]SFT58770.1 hypothetical protein SAMN04515657_1233 [Idiomarina abyssalis]